MNRPDNIGIKDWQILKEKYADNFSFILDKLEHGYPVQYLIGNVEFLNTVINVDERVLIPRFETEYLASLVIEYANDKFKDKIKIIDMGTGSGCLAIALKKNLKSDVTAIDISSEALDLAKQNANNNGVSINFLNQDISEELTDNYDIIISNPPYIPEYGYVSKSVLDYEPHLALFAQDNGLYFYKKIITNNIKHLKKNGLMAFEVGDDIHIALEQFIKENVSLKYEFKEDLTKKIRYLFIYNI